MLLFHCSLVHTFDDSFPFSGLLSLNILLATKDLYFDWLIGIRHCIIVHHACLLQVLMKIYVNPKIILHLTQMIMSTKIYRSSLLINYLRIPAGSVIIRKSVSPCSCCAVLLTSTLEMSNLDFKYIFRTQYRNYPD